MMLRQSSTKCKSFRLLIIIVINACETSLRNAHITYNQIEEST